MKYIIFELQEKGIQHERSFQNFINMFITVTIFHVIFVFEKSLRGVDNSGYLINFSCRSSQAVINNVFIVLEIKMLICISKGKNILRKPKFRLGSN